MNIHDYFTQIRKSVAIEDTQDLDKLKRLYAKFSGFSYLYRMDELPIFTAALVIEALLVY